MTTNTVGLSFQMHGTSDMNVVRIEHFLWKLESNPELLADAAQTLALAPYCSSTSEQNTFAFEAC